MTKRKTLKPKRRTMSEINRRVKGLPGAAQTQKLYLGLIDEMAKSVVAVLAAAEKRAASMKERCAKIADAHFHISATEEDREATYSNGTVRRIAASIRALEDDERAP